MRKSLYMPIENLTWEKLIGEVKFTQLATYEPGPVGEPYKDWEPSVEVSIPKKPEVAEQKRPPIPKRQVFYIFKTFLRDNKVFIEYCRNFSHGSVINWCLSEKVPVNTWISEAFSWLGSPKWIKINTLWVQLLSKLNYKE